MERAVSKTYNKKALLSELVDNPQQLCTIQKLYVFERMYCSLSFKTRVAIKMGRVSWPHVQVDDSVKNMSIEELVDALNNLKRPFP